MLLMRRSLGWSWPASLYDQDFYHWALKTAAALRGGRVAGNDLENVAEEIDGLANRDLRRRRSILSQLSGIEMLLDQSPSLRRAPSRSDP